MNAEPPEAVAGGVRRVLDDEARRNEVRVGVVRFVGFLAIVVLDLATGLLGFRPIENVAQSALGATVGGAALIGLRRARFYGWIPYVLPLVDVTLLSWLLTARLAQLGASVGLSATSALVCGLFAATGALRFQRRSSMWTTALAGAMLVFLLEPYARAFDLVYTLVCMIAVGILAWWLADLVRRSMEARASESLIRRFLPPEVADRAFGDPLAGLASPRALDATVLVSDLRGFTALAESLPPDRVFRFLSRLHGELASVVQHNGGVVDKFLGDGMLAVFGAGPVNDGHATRALAAAREIRAAVERVNTEGLLPAPVRIGIGLHSGPLVAGCLGSGERLEWTVIGDTVNTASRLEALTKELGVDLVLSEAVVSRAAPADARPLGTARLRGREREIAVFTC